MHAKHCVVIFGVFPQFLSFGHRINTVCLPPKKYRVGCVRLLLLHLHLHNTRAAQVPTDWFGERTFSGVRIHAHTHLYQLGPLELLILFQSNTRFVSANHIKETLSEFRTHNLIRPSAKQIFSLSN